MPPSASMSAITFSGTASSVEEKPEPVWKYAASPTMKSTADLLARYRSMSKPIAKV